MNTMNLPNGPGWSPDGGQFWVKEHLLYWEDGDVWDMRDGCVIRVMSELNRDHEDYSAWNKEKRIAVRKGWAEKRKKWAAERETEKQRVRALRRSACKKLTVEEIKACVVK